MANVIQTITCPKKNDRETDQLLDNVSEINFMFFLIVLAFKIRLSRLI